MIEVSKDRKPIIIAGPTASGKSALALQLAKTLNGAILNADALQVYSGWRILTARPSQKDLRTCPHYLYGHVNMHTAYSVGAWLRDIKVQLQVCETRNQRPIIVGGTGLYLSALTQGLVDIPDIPQNIRATANEIAKGKGKEIFAKLLQQEDIETYNQIDTNNPARTQRAWEVLHATGKGLSFWQSQHTLPILPESAVHLYVLTSDTKWLNIQIDKRFDQMVTEGALEECKAALQTWWNPKLSSCKAIGAKELVAFLSGKISLEGAVEQAKTNSRRYAKRQRTWFRNRMAHWKKLHISDQNIGIQKII